MRLQLAGYPAYVPLAQHRAAVAAGGDVAGGLARDPSNIESLELVADSSVIRTVADNSGLISRNAAYVRYVYKILGCYLGYIKCVYIEFGRGGDVDGR